MMDFKAKADAILDELCQTVDVDEDGGTVTTNSDSVKIVAAALKAAFEAGHGSKCECCRRNDEAERRKGIIDATSGAPVVRKVLGALPVTADGAVIGTNAVVYSWWEPQYSEGNGMVQMGETGCIVSAPHGCYSTREAAESARGRA